MHSLSFDYLTHEERESYSGKKDFKNKLPIANRKKIESKKDSLGRSYYPFNSFTHVYFSIGLLTVLILAIFYSVFFLILYFGQLNTNEDNFFKILSNLLKFIAY